MRAELVDAIRARPDDAAPRLVLADWLIDQNDAAAQAAAELIRLQCAPPADADGLWAATARAQRLAEAAARFWLPDLYVRNVCFSRGLPETIDVADATRVDVPLVSHLTTDVPERADALRLPHLESLAVCTPRRGWCRRSPSPSGWSSWPATGRWSLARSPR